MRVFHDTNIVLTGGTVGCPYDNPGAVSVDNFVIIKAIKIQCINPELCFR